MGYKKDKAQNNKTAKGPSPNQKRLKKGFHKKS
jgi:hypothetical protein